MRIANWCAGLLLGLPLAGGAVAPIAALDFTAGAWVDVDATGKARVIEMGRVTRLEDVSQLGPVVDKIKARLRERIETWQFVPAARDGAPVASRTHVSIWLEGVDDGKGGLGVRVRSATTGAELKDINMIGLQIAGNRVQEEGAVTIDVTYDEGGKVVTTAVADSKFFDGHRFTGYAGKALRRNMLAAAQAWKFVPEQIDGHPQAGSGRVPIHFCFSEACAIAREDSKDALGDAQFAAADPAVKLRSAVADTAL
jgi:hypothetical protein